MKKKISINKIAFIKHLYVSRVKEYFQVYVQFITAFVDNFEHMLSKREYASSKISKIQPNLIETITDEIIDEICSLYVSKDEFQFSKIIIKIKS